jgi:hypothetical protein
MNRTSFYAAKRSSAEALGKSAARTPQPGFCSVYWHTHYLCGFVVVYSRVRLEAEHDRRGPGPFASHANRGLLERAEALFDLADEINEAGMCDDLGVPTEVALDEVVSLNDMGPRERIAFGIVVAAHKPEVIGDGGSGGDVVGDDDDGVEFVHVGDFLDEVAGFFEHEQVEAAEGLVHEKEVIRAQDLLNDGAALTLAAGELNGIEAGFVQEFEVVEILDDFVVGRSGVFFFLAGGEKEIGHDGTVLEEGIVLSDDADFTSLYRLVFAVHGDAAGSGFVEAGDDAKELGLSDAARSEEADDLALNAVGANDVFDFGGDVLEDRTTVVLERDIINLEESFTVRARGGHKRSYFRSRVRVAYGQKILRRRPMT